MRILGISGFYHDSAAALVIDGKIKAAAQEERFTRKKHDSGFPDNAIDYVLAEAGISMAEVDFVVFYDKPLLKFDRLLETYISMAPKGFHSFRLAMPVWLREKLFLKDLLLKKIRQRNNRFRPAQLMFSEHHFSHAASAFYLSPFEEAIVLTLDGVGEWATSTVAVGRGSSLEIVRELHFPHSLGLLYSAFTYYLGFKVNSGEYKVMGLAPYGEPVYQELIFEKIVDLKNDGSFRLDQSYFNYLTGLTMTNQKFSDLFGEPVRKPETEALTQFHMNMAASIQAVTEKIVLTITRSLEHEFRMDNLCMAGGVALNCVANGKILRDSGFKNIWIQPAAGDAGGALGAAFALWHHELGNPREPDRNDAMQGSYLGPEFSDEQIEQTLVEMGAVFTKRSREELIKQTALALTESRSVGWFQGRMEFGPRALGTRSILADPRSETVQKELNLRIKYRESFRPFAPSVLREDLSDWFEIDCDSPYMLLVADVKKSLRRELTDQENALFGLDKLDIKRSDIPAVTHVDYSARIQTVHIETNPKYHALISEFKRLTGCPVLVNTSFNVRGEPIVCTPADAFKCFMATDLEVLAMGSYMLEKPQQRTVWNVKRETYKDLYKFD